MADLNLLAHIYKGAAIDTAVTTAANAVARRFSFGGLRALAASEATMFAATLMPDDDGRKKLLETAAAVLMKIASDEAVNLILGPVLPQQHPMAGAASSGSEKALQQILGPTTPRMPSPDELMEIVQEEYNRVLAEQSAFANPKFVFFNTQGTANISKNDRKALGLKIVKGKDGKDHSVEYTRNELYNVQKGSGSSNLHKPLPARPTLTGKASVKVNGKTLVVKREDVHAAITKADEALRGKIGGYAPHTEQMPEGKRFNVQSGSFVATEEVATDVATSTTPATTPVNALPSTSDETWPKMATPVGRKTLKCPKCGNSSKSGTFDFWEPAPMGDTPRTPEQDAAILWGGSQLCKSCRSKLSDIISNSGAVKDTRSVSLQEQAAAEIDAAIASDGQAQLAALQAEADKIAEEFVVASSQLEADEKKLVADAKSISLMGDAAPEGIKKDFETLKFNVQKSRQLVASLEQKNSDIATQRSALCAGVPASTATSKKGGINTMQQALSNAKPLPKKGGNKGGHNKKGR